LKREIKSDTDYCRDREVAGDAEAVCKRVEPSIYSREIAFGQYLRVNSRVIVKTETAQSARFF